MIQVRFQESDLPALARLHKDADFQVVLNRFQEAHQVLAMESLRLEGTPLYRMQGAALLVESFLTELEEARPKIERIQAKREMKR